MAEWVQKGNLKGPQGDPGQDAQLPAGGTEGQVLTKTADGEAWQDAPEPDMTGMATFKSVMGDNVLTKVGEGGQSDFIGTFGIIPEGSDIGKAPKQYAQFAINNVASRFKLAGEEAYIQVHSNNSVISLISDNHDAQLIAIGAIEEVPMFAISDKFIHSITDDASTGSADALATAKAVKDYADAHAMPSVVPISQGGTGATTAEGARTALGIPDIEVATDEEFDSYMGLS